MLAAPAQQQVVRLRGGITLPEITKVGQQAFPFTAEQTLFAKVIVRIFVIRLRGLPATSNIDQFGHAPLLGAKPV
ncbi:Uncharacterised protein [Salmonella enterica subsp. enterica serovar Bovismorbificans]|uniref:Uncharacterized protein n=1 Tax=Salmonella enterica subsp. enterica serovar Bovismorbificans TaxID=58097 RepID=A0A655BKW8_SALET|nr:Uncharacterised protein [Salmonella enterica subsp. enterica serovar Bovismorbificans]CPR55232.1 Uncharacterised protein [Salmonella enterica subsp. enterica serovar Bovismorbificans]